MTQIRKLVRSLKSIKDVKKKINWHPGHMYSGMKAMIGKLATVDCVVEVHDSRIPFTGRNMEFRKHLGVVKPRILVLNKADLADLSDWKNVLKRLEKEGERNVLLTDMSGHDYSLKSRGFDTILQTIVDAVNQSDRFNRQSMEFFKVMIVGIPNVGKSTLINRLRNLHLGVKGQPAAVGATAGVTKAVQSMIKVCQRPTIYCLDTPGVLEPSATKNNDQAMRLGLCSTINDDVINPRTLGEYLLGYLNSTQNDAYSFYYELPEPTEDLDKLLVRISEKFNLTTKFKSFENNFVVYPDYDLACWNFIKNFRKGNFGKVMFD